jgi:hypothetical protein
MSKHHIDGYAKKMRSGEDHSQRYHKDEYKDKMHSEAYAGLPEEKVMKEYPKAQYGLDSYYNDNIHGIDEFAKMNQKQIKKQMNKPYDR